ncbi:MAG: hypothetical protein ND866_03715 [Pyrinomonadaceae bacterium]|nr:hypothetical protein [Pyrinomonadaceae bacterium]
MTVGEEEDLIQTVPRRGYRFTGEVLEIGNGELVIEKHSLTRTLIEELDEPQVNHVEGLPRAVAQPRTSRLWITALAGVIILAVTLGFYLYRRDLKEAPSRQQIRSIAVLPLKSFAPDTESEPLRLRITDAVITSLGGLKDVAVRPTSSVLHYEGEGHDVIEIGQKLEVDAVLDGRVQAEDNRLRVTLQLISVKNGEQLWSEQFDAKAGEILACRTSFQTACDNNSLLARPEKQVAVRPKVTTPTRPI